MEIKQLLEKLNHWREFAEKNDISQLHQGKDMYIVALDDVINLLEKDANNKRTIR